MNGEAEDERAVMRQRQPDRQGQRVSRARQRDEHERSKGNNNTLPRRPEPTMGVKFEALRRAAIFDLDDIIKISRYRNRASRRYSDLGPEPRTIIVHDGAEPLDAVHQVALDHLRMEVRSMLAILEKIQYAEWSHKTFPYVPRCLLYVCGLALAQYLARNGEVVSAGVSTPTTPQFAKLAHGFGDQAGSIPRGHTEHTISEIVWRTSQNAAAFSAHNKIFRGILLFGLGASTLWSVYRSLRYGIITWCQHSLRGVVKRFEGNDTFEGPHNPLKGFKWSVLWRINIML
ncbi:hypothetical protein DL98DRAFT_647881 [Cadophora sp. DSE1049]|nr:hypothetical protein DL98DRAFT_647881 [Cadophora sp. DSE1049]